MAMLNTNLKKIGNRFLKVLQDVETDYIKLKEYVIGRKFKWQ